MLKIQTVCCFLIFFLFTACSNQKESKHYVIAFSQCIGDDAWRATMLEEMKRELSFYAEVTLLYRDAAGNSQQQIAQLRDLVNDHQIDLLIVSPNEAAPLTPMIDSLFQANIPIVVTDRKTSSGLYNAYVGADNIAIGRLAGQYMQHILHGRGRIGTMRGLAGSSAAIERQTGLQQVLDTAAGITLALGLNGDWTKETAYSLAQKNAPALAKLDLILAFNDQMAMGIQQALRENGFVHQKIIGVDALAGPANGLQQIQEGQLFASLLYPTGGAEAIRTAIAILEKKPYVRDNILQTAVIDKENAELMILQSAKIQEQQLDIDKRQALIAEQQKIYQSQQTRLNILVGSLALAVVFGGILIFLIRSNWKKNKDLETQNAEIRAQQAQILYMNEQLQETSEAKRKFFTQVSHEFKTPLTLILAPLELLNAEKNLSSDAREQLQRMSRNAVKLQQLVHDFVDIHRRESIKRQLSASAVPINSFVQQVLASFKPLAQQQRISLSFTNNSSVRELWIDPYLMEQALANLLSNAFKFTRSQGKITVLIEENTFGDFVYLRVLDDGIGIAASDIDHIFEEFYQATPHPVGSGIGLAYVKEIVELHHGQVTVSSKQHAGSSFTLRLPTGDQHLSADERAKTNEKTPISHKITTQDARLTSALPALDTDDEQRRLFRSHQAASLMIIDDHDDIRQLLQQIFADKYNLILAKSLGEAKQKLANNFPDLIICDIMLPDGSGMDLLKDMKNNVSSARVPFVLLSALDTAETRLEGLQAMADAYLPKPFQVAHLEAVIENLLRSRQQLKAHYASLLDKDHTVDIIDGSLTEQDKRFLQHLELLVEERLSDQTLTVEDIADALKISRVQLYRKAKMLLKCSMNEYIVQRRLKKAKFLILDGLPINEIADKAGFSSATYFAAAFKKQFGQTPTAFKKELLGR